MPHDINTRFDYDRMDAEIIRLRAYRDRLDEAQRLMDAVTTAMQATDDTIEGPDYSAAIASVEAAMKTRQDALDRFDERYQWGEHGVAYRVAS
jgi:uncharacterized membrane protein